jgi:hypothetical protein
MIMNNGLIETMKNVYSNNFKKHGASPLGTFQNNIETQYLRYERLLLHLLNPDLSIFTIHDVGSGICDLHKYLLEKKVNHQYSGTEIVQEMNDYASSLFPHIKLYNRDLLNADDNEQYDFVVLSGTLNLFANLDIHEWEKYVCQLIKKMFKIASKSIAFNFLTSYNTFSDPSLFYIDPKTMFDFCMKNLSRFVHIDHAYPLYECTITVHKKEYIQEIYQHKNFLKYFKN